MEFILSILAQVLDFLVNRTLPAVIVLVIGILAIVIVTRVVDAALKKSKLEKAAHSLIKSVVKVALFVLLVGLAIYSCTLSEAGAGLRFYLVPSLSRLEGTSIWTVTVRT